MQNLRLTFTLLTLALLAGCNIHIENKKEPPRVIYTDDDPTLREIRAAGTLSIEIHKYNRFEAIAKRVPLSPAAQSYLVETAAHHLDLDIHLYNLYLTLIDNPSFNTAGHNAILDHLDALDIDIHRVNVLEKLDTIEFRPADPPPPDYESASSESR